MACLLAAFCIMAPFARLPLQPFTAFIPVFAAIIVINDLITAALMISQFWVVRWTWLLVLACGNFFTALIVIPNALTFPGAFAPAGLLGAGPLTASWLSVCWHLGLSTFLIIAMLVRASRETTGLCQRAPGRAIALGFAFVATLVCGLTWAIITNEESLPRIFVDRAHLSRTFIPPVSAMALDVVALALLLARGRSVLDLWLTVTCCTWLFEVLLGGILAGSRYTLGWYAGRIFELVDTFFVLLLLLSETTALYANMVRASMQRRGARQARQIAMDAMAASIGHEINQPLTAVVTNADAGMCQVTRAEPDLKEIHATFSDIAAGGQRIREIIGGVRTMFQNSAHDRQPLNLNRVVHGVLAAVELDLRLGRVTVKTDLDNNLPPVLADSGQLHQLFANLITNALEAMAAVAGRPSVLRVTSGIVAGSSDIAVTVEDTGVGIGEKNGDRIFEPFFSTKTAGTGIGLTICQVITNAHGGSLRASRNKPYGTIFRLTLPMGGNE